MAMKLNRLLKGKPWVQQGAQKNALSHWFASSSGKRLIEQEEALLKLVLPNLFGMHCFVSGIHYPTEALNECYIRHHFHSSVLTPEQAKGMVENSLNPSDSPQQVVTSLSSLPFRSNSVDAAILFHSLDFETNIYRAVKEVARITTPGGTMVIVGFNPLSLWGIYRLFRWRSQQTAPWCSNFISMPRLSDWLKLLDFEIEGYKTAFHFPSLHVSSWLDELVYLQRLSARWGSQFSGVYVLVSKKRREAMTPLRPKWQVRKPGFVTSPLVQAHRVSSIQTQINVKRDTDE